MLEAAVKLQDRVDELLATYRDGLLKTTLPFWFPRSVDETHGGFMFARDRDGSLLDTDKAVWTQGRASWLLATLYSEVEPRPEWLQWARHGIDFLRRHGFDADGRMFFLVTRDGQPLRKRRYIFSETFMIAALAAYGRARRTTQRPRRKPASFTSESSATSTRRGSCPPSGILTSGR